MKNIFLIWIVLFTVSCESMMCMPESPKMQYDAQSMYDTFGTVIAQNIDAKKAAKMFGCHYRFGDRVYVYTTFWDKKYILVRRGKALTYVVE
jgi:hypothetical protein